MNTFSVIITAGGIGKRMGGDLPKQFLLVAGKPILIHTLEKIHSFDPEAEIIITLPDEWRSYWNKLLINNSCTIQHTVIEGGLERYHSVKNAIQCCNGDFIAIHDGVRPLVSKETYERLKKTAIEQGTAIPVVPVKESIRKIEGANSQSQDRTKFKLVQTPQAFSKTLLQTAYESKYHPAITDDASLVQECGYSIYLVEGNEENIKITSPVDLIIAEALLLRQS
jgi:2-C-methyl-D-erythritol 4-phosphate cytidylyltransferase